jgi:hypothetical protein
MRKQQKNSDSEYQSFIIHENIIRMSSLLSNEQLGQLLRQLYLYAGQGEVPDEESNVTLTMIFNEWRLQFEYDKKHYEHVRQKRSEAGRKGLAKRWQKSDATEDHHSIDDGDEDTMAEENMAAQLSIAEEDPAAQLATGEDHAAPSESANDCTAMEMIANDSHAIKAIAKIADNGNGYDSKKKEISPRGETKKKVSLASSPTLEKRKNDFYQSIVPYTSQYDSEMLNDFYQYWTELDKRRRHMRFEMQKTWETSKRLSTWSRKQYPR